MSTTSKSEPTSIAIAAARSALAAGGINPALLDTTKRPIVIRLKVPAAGRIFRAPQH